MPTTGYIPPRNLTNPGPFSKGAKKIAQDENFLFGITGEERVGINTFYFKFKDETAEPIEIWNTMGNINWPQLRQITKATDARYAPSETSDISLLWERMQAVLKWERSQKMNSIFSFEGRHFWLRIQMRYRQKAGGRVDKVSGAFNLPLFGFLGPAWRVNPTTGKGQYAGGSSLAAGWYYAKTAGKPTLINSVDELLKIIEATASQHRRGGGREGYRLEEAAGENEANAQFEKWCQDFGKKIMDVKDSFSSLIDGDYYADDSKYLPIKNEEEYDNLVDELKKLGNEIEMMGSNYEESGDTGTSTELENAAKSVKKIADDMHTSKTKYMFSGLDIMNENEQPAIEKRKFNSLMMDLAKIPNSLMDASSVASTYDYSMDVRNQGKDPFYRMNEGDSFFREGQESTKWDEKMLNECGIMNFLDTCHCLRDDLAGTRECSTFGCSENDLAEKCREMAQTLIAIADNIDREMY